MAIPRKRALERLQKLLSRVNEHLAKIAEKPGDPSENHWRHEARNWLDQMEELLPHVGNKTASEWQPHIAACRAKLEA